MAWNNHRRRGMSLPKEAREPQPAFGNKAKSSICNAIAKMKEKQIALAKQPFTYPELMELFVDKKHHDAFRYTYGLVEPSGAVIGLYVDADTPPHLDQHSSGKQQMVFSWHGRLKDGFYVPREQGASREKPAYILRGQADPELVERYVQVEQDLLDIQCRFALVNRVFVNLNRYEICRTPAQIRYVWPAITVLLAKAGYHEEAQELAEPSPRAGASVNVPGWLAGWLRETNDTIARALMLDDVEKPGHTQLTGYHMTDTFLTD